MNNTKILLVAVMTAILAMAASCQKDSSSHLETDPYTIGIENISANAQTGTVKIGDIFTFDVMLYYTDSSTPEGYRTIKDDGTVTSIEVTDGLSVNGFGSVTAIAYSDENEGTETVTVRLPHGYQNGEDIIKTLKVKIAQ